VGGRTGDDDRTRPSAAWQALTRYTGGLLIVALIDAVGIGLTLLLLGIPLWVSLILLTFLEAFVPVLGATVSGAVAVLVTPVTNGVGDAVIVLVVVLVVQQLEGDVLQPLRMRRAVDLHPVVALVAVRAGTLLPGVSGALLAVPTVAVLDRLSSSRGPTRWSHSRHIRVLSGPPV
jgi:predicted PurR-regulated permease PerM